MSWTKSLFLSDLRFEDYKLDIGMVLKNTDGETLLEYGNISDTSESDMIYDLNNESITMTFGEGRENIKSILKTIIFYSLLYLIIGIAAVYILSFLCSCTYMTACQMYYPELTPLKIKRSAI